MAEAKTVDIKLAQIWHKNNLLILDKAVLSYYIRKHNRACSHGTGNPPNPGPSSGSVFLFHNNFDYFVSKKVTNKYYASIFNLGVME